LKESRYVRLANTMFRVLKRARIPLFLHKKSNHLFTVWQHIILLVLRQYERNSYRMFVEWLVEAYYFRTFIQLSNIPHYTTLQKFAAKTTETLLAKIISSFVLLLHIRRRMLKIKPSVGELNFEENDEPITLIVDASGLAVLKKGDYIEEKWVREKKEFIKLHIAVDEKSKKVISFRITKGNVHDTKKFTPLIKEAAEKYDIDKVHADKAYDNRKNFNILDDINVEPSIIIRKNASTKSKEGCPLRRDEVFLIKKLGFEGWKQLKDAGRRWIAEIVFSSIKRVMGEDLLSKKFAAQKVEAGLKVMLYNQFMNL
jgi:Transposase DDE domain